MVLNKAYVEPEAQPNQRKLGPALHYVIEQAIKHWDIEKSPG